MKKIFVVLLSALSLATSNAVADESVVAKEWAAYMETLAPLATNLEKIAPGMDDPQQRQELYLQLYSMMAHGFLSIAYSDPQYPDFTPIFNQAFNYLSPNPDNVYYGTRVDGDGVYKISGFRGTTHYVTFHIGNSTITMEGSGGFSHGSDHRIDDQKIDNKTGYFEAILSRTRPDGYKGNWWKLDPEAKYLLVRQSSYDWLHEVDGRFAIERLDRPAAKPRPSADEIAAILKQIGPAAENWTRQWLDRDADLVNKLVVHDINAIGGLTTQQYFEGRFEVAADEALVMETEVPKKCGYWNVQLTDQLWRAIDFLNRQSNLNGFSAKIDKDGKFRAVISAKDPGVPNWLDNGGYKSGFVFGRWADCSSHPLPTLTKVKLADLRQHLPADTPVVSAEARDAALRLRRQGAQLRRRW